MLLQITSPRHSRIAIFGRRTSWILGILIFVILAPVTVTGVPVDARNVGQQERRQDAADMIVRHWVEHGVHKVRNWEVWEEIRTELETSTSTQTLQKQDRDVADDDDLHPDIIAIVVVASTIGFVSLLSLLRCALRTSRLRTPAHKRRRKITKTAKEAEPRSRPPKSQPPTPKPTMSGADLRDDSASAEAAVAETQEIRLHVSSFASSSSSEEAKQYALEVPKSPQLHSSHVQPTLPQHESSMNWDEASWEGPWISSGNSVFGSEYTFDGGNSSATSTRGRHSFCPDKGVYEIPYMEKVIGKGKEVEGR